MHDAFIPNGRVVWELSSNCKVVKCYLKYMIQLLQRKRIIDLRSVQTLSSIMYDRPLDTENDAVNFGDNFECIVCRNILITIR